MTFNRRNAIGLASATMALSATTSVNGQPQNLPPGTEPKRKPVLIFDVNETLLDIDALNPLFDRIFRKPGVMREWFAQLVLYSQAVSLSGRYAPFGALGAGVLRMTGAIHGITIRDEHVSALRTAIGTLPVHPEAPVALRRLSAAGFRMVTLTNTPKSNGPDALTLAGVGDMFEQKFTVEPVRRFKPAPETYRLVTEALAISPESACMIASHTWDTIGAQSAGWHAALVTRSVNAVLEAPDVPIPEIVGKDLVNVADLIIARWP